MVLREAQNHKNNKFSFIIRKVNQYFEQQMKEITNPIMKI